MKNSNTCPFCGSTKIFIDKALKNDNIWLMHDSTYSFYIVDRYICLSCGHIEEWVDKEYYERQEEEVEHLDDNGNLCLGSLIEKRDREKANRE